MTKPPSFRKVERAYHHINELDRVLAAFIKSNPYEVVIEEDPHTKQVLYCLSRNADIPVDVSLIVGDILQNLRSSLDHLAYALVVANNQTPNTKTYFPITEEVPEPTNPKSDFSRKVCGMSQDAINTILLLKPYKGGNHALWGLHALNNWDKHNLIVTVGASLFTFDLTQHIEATEPPMEHLGWLARRSLDTEFWQEWKKAIFPLKKGDVIWADPPNSKFNENARFRIHVAFSGPAGLFEGEPVLQTLRGLTHAVSEVHRRLNEYL
jgi:hypothetical protein